MFFKYMYVLERKGFAMSMKESGPLKFSHNNTIHSLCDIRQADEKQSKALFPIRGEGDDVDEDNNNYNN